MWGFFLRKVCSSRTCGVYVALWSLSNGGRLNLYSQCDYFCEYVINVEFSWRFHCVWYLTVFKMDQKKKESSHIWQWQCDTQSSHSEPVLLWLFNIILQYNILLKRSYLLLFHTKTICKLFSFYLVHLSAPGTPSGLFFSTYLATVRNINRTRTVNMVALVASCSTWFSVPGTGTAGSCPDPLSSSKRHPACRIRPL